MDSSTSTSLSKKSTKLSVKNQTCFKRTSRSSASKNKTDLSLSARKETLLRKAEELSILCEIKLCLICYDRDGELETYPKDQSMVRDVAERFSKLSVQEKQKKNKNLSKYLKKKLENEKKQSLTNKDNKFLDKVLEMENSLETHLRILDDKLRFLYSLEDQTTEIIPENSTAGLYSSAPIVDHHHHHVSCDSSNLPSNYSFILYNHDNNIYTQLPSSASSFEQRPYGNSDMIRGEQVTRGFNNNDLPMTVWNQTPSIGNPIMFS